MDNGRSGEAFAQFCDSCVRNVGSLKLKRAQAAQSPQVHKAGVAHLRTGVICSNIGTDRRGRSSQPLRPSSPLAATRGPSVTCFWHGFCNAAASLCRIARATSPSVPPESRLVAVRVGFRPDAFSLAESHVWQAREAA